LERGHHPCPAVVPRPGAVASGVFMDAIVANGPSNDNRSTGPVKAGTKGPRRDDCGGPPGLSARGDERLSELTLPAPKNGGNFKKALYAWDGDPAPYLDRQRSPDEPFPWEIVDAGVRRDYLWREWQRYQDAVPTAKCPPAGCAACGRCGMEAWGGIRRERTP